MIPDEALRALGLQSLNPVQFDTLRVAGVSAARVREVAEREGAPARLLQRADCLDWSFLDGVSTLGITAGASAPELLVRQGEHNLRLSRELREAFEALERVADLDQMTGLINRATFFQQARAAYAESGVERDGPGGDHLDGSAFVATETHDGTLTELSVDLGEGGF